MSAPYCGPDALHEPDREAAARHDPRLLVAQAVGTACAWTLSHVFHRPAATFPGKTALQIDPQLIADLAPRMREGCIVVVGTNGKTTVTNLLADAFEAAGKTVVCNRTGANLASGVASALLHTGPVDWGILECDELWLAKVAPQLRPRYVVLLNLFRDQLDRMGEIEHVQDSIVGALTASPETALVYNCDDPLCQAIAARVDNELVPFGIESSLGLAPNRVTDLSVCQRCDTQLEYQWRQYGQLGAYRCPTCGFTRPEPVYRAQHIACCGMGGSVTVVGACPETTVRMRLDGTYMAYNLLAVCATAHRCGVPAAALQQAAGAFAPHNGRLERYVVDGRTVMLNLAKNPTGFNQNLRIIENDPGPIAVAFFINDNTADGHDVSWLWDVDFEELAGRDDLVAYCGGLRGNDMQVRLKYAGIDAALVDEAQDFLAEAAGACEDATFYLIANYTALPNVKSQLDALQSFPAPRAHTTGCRTASAACRDDGEERLVIVHVYPELLNLYGDSGNVTVLAKRARWRGMDVEVRRVEHGERLCLADANIVFLGGGPDREQRLASKELFAQADELRAYVEDNGVLLAICGGYQILGRTWIMDDEPVPGLGLLDAETKRAEGGSHNRLVGNIVLDSSLASVPVVGYENHAGRTFVTEGCEPFGHVHGGCGNGNNGSDGADGCIYRNVVGSYLHGPLLAKNPEVADALIQRALQRRASKEGRQAPALAPLDDACELAANACLRARLKLR